MPEAFGTFLLRDEKGPKIDHDSANLLWLSGVVNHKIMISFSQLPIQRMLVGLTNWELENIRTSGFIKLIMYGEYIKDFSLITKKGSINFAAI
jgi:hypothetical protein